MHGLKCMSLVAWCNQLSLYIETRTALQDEPAEHVKNKTTNEQTWWTIVAWD